MIIAGFQPLSLIDFPGRTCSIVFTQGCAFRCGYCHNPELVPSRGVTSVSEESVLSYLRDHRAMLDGVCVTGGEPTLQPDLRAFLTELKNLGLQVKLDTNGIFPSVVKEFVEAKLVDFIAMDLKHLWTRYLDVIRVLNKDMVAQCKETFEFIQTSGIEHEFRTTVYRGYHSENDLVEMASWLLPGERYALQEIRYEHTLQSDLEKQPPLDLQRVAERIRSQQPDLEVIVRA